MKLLLIILVTAGFYTIQSLISSQASAAQPVEIGKVQWGRDLEAGLSQSKQTSKPVLLLFQEVPGCSGCQQFGRDVLADERVVASIEENFIPIFIYNNRSGKDAEILKRYNEPAWNFQVIRFLNAEGKDIIARKDGVWTVSALAARMVATLQAAQRPVGSHLEKLTGMKVNETTPATTNKLERVAFAQACFWTGEARLGQIEGVVLTEAGFLEGREVTLVAYDPKRLPLESLIRQATDKHCADRIYVVTSEQRQVAEKIEGGRMVSTLDASYRPAPTSDQKRQIQGTRLEGRSLTAEQATKVNAFIRSDPVKAAEYLP